MNVQNLIAKYKSIGIITLSLLVGAIITFIALPFLTRLYSVHDFGEYGVVLALVSVLSTIANLRLDQAQLIAKEEDQKKLIFEGFIISLLFCIITAIILIYFFNLNMIVAISFGILSNTLVQCLYNYKFSREEELFCAGLNIFRSLVVVFVQLVLPSFLSISLINSYTISSILIIFVVIAYILVNQLYNVSWRSFKNYKDFIFSNTPHALLNSFSHNLPYYIVSHFIGYQAVGYYSIVERTLRLPINLMSQTIRQYYIRKFKKESSVEDVLRNSIFLSVISLPFFAVFFVLPESFYLMIFGKEWIGISIYFKILALGYWAVFCNPPSSAYLIAKRESNILLKLQIIELIFKFLLFIFLFFTFANKIYLLLAVPFSLIFYNFSILYIVRRRS